MGMWLQFRLLTTNAFRILWKSKVLVFQLILLLLIGITILGTIVLSNYSLEASKETILRNGNLADFTITIPELVRENSLKQPSDSKEQLSVYTYSNSDDGVEENISIYSGNTPADNQLKQQLNSLGLQYSLSRTVNMSDILSGNSFIVSNSQLPTTIEPEVVNELILNEGSNSLPSPIYNDKSTEEYITQYQYFTKINKNESFNLWSWRNFHDNYFTYEQYMEKQPWNLAKLITNSIWRTDNGQIQDCLPIILQLAQAPTSKEEYEQKFNLYIEDSVASAYEAPINTNSYWYKWSQEMGVNGFKPTDYGFNITMTQKVPLISNLELPITVEAYDLTSYFVVGSTNFMNANKGKKAFIPKETFEDIQQLPFKNYSSFDSSINPSTNINVYNPETGMKEPYPDFVTWMEKLDDKYKVKVNSLSYVLIGEGLSPDMMYPVLDSNQMLVNSKNTGVLYTNSAGFARSTYGGSSTPDVYYSVKFPSYFTEYEQKQSFNNLVQYSTDNYGQNTAFYLNDPNQPNYVLYLRTNFLNNLQNLILIITLIIAIVIGLLSLFFIATLLRSIIKQSKITFGIGLANGVSKMQLALSFFPFALVPAILCGFVGFICAYFLMTPMNNVFADYWTLSIPKLAFDWYLLIFIPLIVFVILFILNVIVVFWTLRKNTQSIMNDSSEFKINWLIIHTKWLTQKLSSLGSFRLTFMMSNITRFLILTLVVFSFVSLATVAIGSLYQFQSALNYTNRNKNYTFAFDLFTPTINNGYYSAMPYSQIGVSGQGIYNEYTSEGAFGGNYLAPNSPEAIQTSAPYTGNEYANALIYPYSTTVDGNNLGLKYFTSLFMPSLKLALEIDRDMQFFKSKVITKLFLDMNLDLAGSKVNPWEMCRAFLPESVVSMADTLFERQIETNFNFYLWLQKANKYGTDKLNGSITSIPQEYTYYGKPVYYTSYLPNVNEQPFTNDGSDLTDNFDDATNKKQWYFIKETDPISSKQKWIVNEDSVFTMIPSFMVKEKSLKLFIQLLTNNENTLFQYWYKNIYDGNPNKGKENQTMPNFSFKLADNIVPVETTDETYTYIESDIVEINNKQLINTIGNKVVGIKPNSRYVILHDENDQDLKPLLNVNIQKENGVVVYPLIINEVVQKKQNIKIGDTLMVRAKNTYDRYNLKNIGENPWNEVTFKVVGVTNSKSEEQFYTSQDIANHILGFFDFSKRAADKENPNSTQWNGPKYPGKDYVPFNGVFTDQEIPQLALNFGGIYVPSGLSTAAGSWDPNIGEGENQHSGAGTYQIKKNYAIINQLSAINYYVDKNSDDNSVIEIPQEKQKWLTYTPEEMAQAGASYDQWNPNDPNTNTGGVGINANMVGQVMNRIINIWDTTSSAVVQLQSVDTPYINSLIGPTMDKTISSVEEVVMICLVPTLLIIIGLLASMIVVEARRLIAMLKVLGYSDLSNAFSFMFVYVIVLFLGTLLSIPFTYGVLSILKTMVFTSFNIIISPIAPVWIYFAAFGAVGLIFFSLFVYIWTQLKKFKLAQEISVR